MADERGNCSKANQEVQALLQQIEGTLSHKGKLTGARWSGRDSVRVFFRSHHSGKPPVPFTRNSPGKQGGGVNVAVLTADSE